ncbi:hypothetical protein EG346_15850 [Chryseobacterium carnipullorum]|uniref:Uncharacterized protein n=1 Tax=Chryseobacterium carnipullorum TaxID=1124835 RepID=A0A376DST5_CHRCU|nr:hypothetical protein [Chryseobacterium carnipullorum]AZA49559.1 hypothetical protein EG346_15850 [Chryseobacterium carnipullorum]AZA64456.1 hypothetical protein EG345_06865 [Chryseobacterium carnipullorum]STC94816.1 Uncharacterised protein [Chryseobacterium carnipullorum]
MSDNKPLSFYGQIDYTELREALKTGKVKATWVEFKNKGKRLMVDINVWVKEEADQYQHNASIQVQNKEEFQSDNKAFIGNLKYKKPKAVEASPESVSDAVGSDEDDDLPY